MFNRPLNPDSLECLVAIAEEANFDRAAARLSITQSAVSQRLRALEADVGTVLIVRSRPARPTQAGRLLLRHALQMRLLRADLEQDLRGLTPASASALQAERLSIAVNADSIATWALPGLTAPVLDGLLLEIIADDQDFTQAWLREGQVVGCVTAMPQPLRGCKVVPLGAMKYVAVASPHYAARFAADGLSAHNFRDLVFVAFNRKDDLQAQFVQAALGLGPLTLNQRFVPSSEGQVRAVLADWGVSVVPELLVREPLAAGALVNVAPAVSLPVSLYWHCWNQASVLLEKLTLAVTAAASRSLTSDALAGHTVA